MGNLHYPEALADNLDLQVAPRVDSSAARARVDSFAAVARVDTPLATFGSLQAEAALNPRPSFLG